MWYTYVFDYGNMFWAAQKPTLSFTAVQTIFNKYSEGTCERHHVVLSKNHPNVPPKAIEHDDLWWFFKARIIIHLMPQLARRVTYHRDPTCVTRHGTSLVATRALVETVLVPTAAPGRATTAPTRSSATPSRSGAGARAGRRQRCGGDATVGWFRNPGDTQLDHVRSVGDMHGLINVHNITPSWGLI